MSGKDKWVRRFSVDETAKHKNGFTIYKITSVLFPIDAPEAVTVVSVWKRYSDVRRLHRSMCALHAGLHLPPRGTCTLPSTSYFRRFQKEVIEERAKAIKRVLEFIAEHQLLFTSTEFVNFLQSGHPEPSPSLGAIASIRAALRLAPAPPLPLQRERSPPSADQPETRDETDFASIPKIPIYEAAVVELKPHSSNDSLNSLESLNDDLYDQLSKLTVQNKGAVKNRLPDLINFDAPSSSRLENYVPKQSDTSSLNSTLSSRSNSRMSLYSKTSLSNVDSKTRTEDSYVFEAGYLLNMAARCEDMREYQRAFDFYKSGIEKMLVGVQTDSDPQRRALIKDKTNKYLSYAEEIYKNHLCDVNETLIPEPAPTPINCPVPLSMLRRPYEDLALYRVLAVVADTMMLVLHKAAQVCYAMKVIQKIPNNLTEFDEYFLQRTNETRQPVLPTSIPYMVPLQAYIETNSLIFLILSYAPGEKLLDYIKNYVKSIPSTPAREVNLENVFSEPMRKIEEVEEGDEVEELVRNSQTLLRNVDRALHELVRNSQTLLRNVDRALREEGEVQEENGRGDPTLSPPPRAALPPSAVRQWAAQLLTALESLHNAGVICRDLNPSNILLGDGGQIILTYFAGYPLDVSLPQRSLSVSTGRTDLFVAPELYNVCTDIGDERLCDFWSFGVIMYELLCGVPLSHYHKSVFTSHTVLCLPEELPVEEESLLTQLLTYDPAERLGRDGVDEIKQHPYFRHTDWTLVQNDWRVPG
ncbi:ribosomal protein S6 kinase delta-1 [Cydia amplana]|uniref:ribosomal protein S6 kinase delta-1 n=1 Tax=Cydia amplana TaxID=1869771 RepID=UPI002FE6486F